MALQNACGFETGGNYEFHDSSGTFSVQSTTTAGSHSGFALRVNPTTTALGYASLRRHNPTTGANSQQAVASDEAFFTNFAFRVATRPAANSEEIFRSISGAGANQAVLRLNSTGTISVYNGATLVSTGSTVLALNTWYTIGFWVNLTADDFELRINGTTELSSTNTNFSGGSPETWVYGKAQNRNSQTIDVYYDDIVIDDASWPPSNGVVRQLTAGSAGTYQTFSRGGSDSGANWSQCNNANDDTSYVLSTLNTANKETETLSVPSGIGTIFAVKTGVIARATTAGSTIKLLTRSNTTETILSNIQPGTTYELIADMFDTDPATSATWTRSGLTTLQVGAQEADTGQTTRITYVFATIYCTPGYNATASLTVGAATASASATFAAGTKTATAPLAVGRATLSASATRTVPVYTGTASLTAGAATLTSSASFFQGLSTGTASLTVGAVTASVSATFAPGTKTATASLQVGPATTSISATHVTPTYTASAALAVAPVTFVSSATFSPGTKTATVALTVGNAELAAVSHFATNCYVRWSGFDMASYQEPDANDGAGSDATFSSSVTFSGSGYSLFIDPATTALGYFRYDSASAIATSFFRFHFRVKTAPASDSEVFFRASNGTTTKATLRLNSSRQIEVWGTTLLDATTAETLDLDTWYTIEFKVSTGVGAQAYELKIDGSTVLSDTATTGSTGTNRAWIGKSISNVSQQVEFYYDDFAWRDGDWVGEGSAILLKANAAGTFQNFTRGGTDTGTNWGQIAVIPIGSTFLVSTNNTSHVETENIENMPTGISTVYAARLQGFAQRDGASSGSLSLRAYQGSAYVEKIITTSAAPGTLIVQDLDMPLSPAGEYWTVTNINSLEIGAKENHATNKSRLNGLFFEVDYVPTEAFTATSTLTVGAAALSASSTFSAGTKTATAALTTGRATLSASATRTVPVYTGAAPLTVGAATSSSLATFSPGTKTATAALAIAPASLSATASHTAPTYSGTATLTVAAATTSMAASFSPGTKTGTAALVAGPASIQAAATFVSPVYTATSALIVGVASIDASATFAAGTKTATASLVVGAAALSASAESVVPSFTGTADLMVGAVVLAAESQFSAGTKTATAELVVAAATFSAEAEHDTPIYAATSTVTVGAATLSATGIFAQAVASASAALTTGSAVLAATSTFDAPVYVGTASLQIAASTISASAEFSPGTKTGTASLTVGAGQVSASATHSIGAVVGTASLVTAAAISASLAEFLPGTKTGTTSLTTGTAQLSAASTFTAPTYAATAPVVVGAVLFSAIGQTEAVYTATAALMVGPATSSVSATFAAPTYSGTAALVSGPATLSAQSLFTAPVYTATAALQVGAATASAVGVFGFSTITATASLVVGAATLAAQAITVQPVFGAPMLVQGLVFVSGLVDGAVAVLGVEDGKAFMPSATEGAVHVLGMEDGIVNAMCLTQTEIAQ